MYASFSSLLFTRVELFPSLWSLEPTYKVHLIKVIDYIILACQYLDSAYLFGCILLLEFLAAIVRTLLLCSASANDTNLSHLM
jgi:hypothetical protein